MAVGVVMNLHDRRPISTRLSVFALLATGTLASHAGDDAAATGQFTVKGSITAGIAFRTVSQDTDLLANVNSSLVGIPGTALTPTTGRNQDDGNLNFNKGAPVSEVVNGYLSVAYRNGDYSVLASVKAWYDYAVAKAGHPWGSIPNGYTP